MAKCSMYRDIYDKTSQKHVEVDAVLAGIKSGRWKQLVFDIRSEIDTTLRRRLKEKLPSVCFCGTFAQRFDVNIIEHSGFAILDFDHVENLLMRKADICRDKYTYACFVSPSGDGLKVLVKIPADAKLHRDHYRGLMKKYPELDATSINLSRVCYVSYDNELYLNSDSEVWTERVEVVLPSAAIERAQAQTTNFAKIQIAAEMIRNAPDGEKHKTLIRAARLLGGYVAAGIVEEHEAVRALSLEINRKNCDDFRAAENTILDGIEYGKAIPINNTNEVARVKAIKEELIIIDGEPARDVIYLDDVRDSIVYSFENGSSRGESTHFIDLDAAYRMARGELTILHGFANHGKSAMLLQIMLIKSVKDGHKWGIFSPENYPASEFYKDLIHTYIGKSTEKHHHNQMSIDELNRGMDFVREHFFFMYPENDAPTPDYINMRFREMIIKHNIDGCVIDPYNQLDTDIHDTGGKEHMYLSKFLSKEKRFAVENKVFFFIVTHPRGDGELSGANYKLPRVYSLSGGAMWNNKADNILCVHRPNFSDWTDPAVIFASQKIKKQKLNGIPCEVSLTFDRMTNRYYQANGFNPLEKDNPPDLRPNLDFCEPIKPDDIPF